MSKVVALSGSPAISSRSNGVLNYAARKLALQGVEVEVLTVHDFPAEDLLYCHFQSPAVQRLQAIIADAQGILLATPVYKASFTGGLKAILDLLPQNALSGKTVLPIAVGGTAAHLLMLDYGLRPVLTSLGESFVLQGVYVLESQLSKLENGEVALQQEIQTRLDQALERFHSYIQRDILSGGANHLAAEQSSISGTA